MFSLTVVDTDCFTDMPVSAQALYFHLGMHGDDDGFVSSPRKIARAVGCNDDDIRVLALKNFIIPFENGIVVIRDWNVNNTLKNNRYHETVWQAEKATLSLDRSGRWNQSVSRLEPDRTQSVSDLEPEHNITKHNRGEGETPPTVAAPPKMPKEKYGQYGWVKLTEEEYSRLSSDLGKAELNRCITYIDESAQTSGNKNHWQDWNLVIRRCHREGWGLGHANGKSNSKDRIKTAADYDDGEDFACNGYR